MSADRGAAGPDPKLREPLGGRVSLNAAVLEVVVIRPYGHESAREQLDIIRIVRRDASVGLRKLKK